MITELEMTRQDMESAEKNGYLCAECQSKVTVCWGGVHGVNSYVLVCGLDINHHGITRHDKKEEQKLREGFSMESRALQNMDKNMMLERVNMARFPQQLKPEEKNLLAQVAITYGFDPLMAEISIFQGRPFVSIDGRYRKAQETGELNGVSTRPATEQERKDWQIPEGDYFFRAEVMRKGSTYPFVGWGRVFTAEQKGPEYLPVVKNPQRMAEKRAEAQALRKAFNIPLPSIENVGSPDVEDGDMPLPPGVIEGTGRVIEPAVVPPPSTQAVVTPPAAVIPQTVTTTPQADGDKDWDKLGADREQIIAEEMWGNVQAQWLKDSLSKLNWPPADVKQWILRNCNGTLTGKALRDFVSKLNVEQSQKLIKEINDRLAKGQE